ncbi:hypothetical protein [Alicyclobacillus sp. ALC3]|nr:hypothetical protein [Alicyclobacillus sp. ALC3]
MQSLTQFDLEGIWYVQRVLQSFGIVTTWNGHVWNFLLPGAE